MTSGVPATVSSPARIELAELIGLKQTGESLRVGASRVRALDAGGHISRFKGRGVEFDEARPYEPGDDLRTIDWRVTARTGKTHTKVFREERSSLWTSSRSSNGLSDGNRLLVLNRGCAVMPGSGGPGNLFPVGWRKERPRGNRKLFWRGGLPSNPIRD